MGLFVSLLRALASLATLSAFFTLPRFGSPDDPVDATFVDASGTRVALSAYRGKQQVVLLFMRGFKGDFACYYCGKQVRAYKASYESIKAAGSEVLVVLPGAHDAAGFLKTVGTSDSEHPEPDFRVPFPVLLDAGFAACRTFSVPFDPSPDAFPFPVSEPATVVVGRDGRIVYAYHGTNPPDRPEVAAIVDVLEHGPPKSDARAAPAHAQPIESSLPWRSYADALAHAPTDGRPLLLDFHALW